jgi:hypothetical protein
MSAAALLSSCVKSERVRMMHQQFQLVLEQAMFGGNAAAAALLVM